MVCSPKTGLFKKKRILLKLIIWGRRIFSPWSGPGFPVGRLSRSAAGQARYEGAEVTRMGGISAPEFILMAVDL
jgi:hypothetical protein